MGIYLKMFRNRNRVNCSGIFPTLPQVYYSANMINLLIKLFPSFLNAPQGQCPRRCGPQEDLESVQAGQNVEEGDDVPGKILHVSVLGQDDAHHYRSPVEDHGLKI